MRSRCTGINRAFALVGGLVLFASGWSQAGKLEISVEPLFLDQPTSNETIPALITVTNEGADTRGFIFIKAETATITTPIDLPKGSEKAVIVYIPPNGYQPVPITLETGVGSVSAEFRADGADTIPQVLIVTDTPGIGAFLRKRPPVSMPRNRRWQLIFDTYGSPDRLPDRVVGYSAVSAVVLVDGFERMSDEAAQTLKLYLLSGGTLVFVGGSRGPAAERPPWRGILPVSQLEVRNTGGSQIKFTQLGKAVTDKAVTLSLGKIHPQARTLLRTAHPLVTARRYGAGQVVHLAYNPFEAPLNRIDDRREIFATTLQTDLTGRSMLNYLLDALTSREGGSYGGVPPSGLSPQGDDPFSAAMPSTSTILGILFVYFLIVGPVNLIVLKRLNRGELAWITGPVLSVIFAAIFFRYAGGLYGAGLSRMTSALVMVQSGEPSAYVVGESQVFFPAGGQYDLKVPEGVEKLWAGTDEFDFGRKKDAIPIVDVGSLAVPSMPVSNLSFQHFSYSQRVRSEARAEASLQLVPEGPSRRLRGWITNLGPQKLVQAQLVFPGRYFTVGDIEPGQRIEVDARSSESAINGYYHDLPSVLAEMYERRPEPGRIALVATIDGLETGPQIGTSTGRSKTQLLLFLANQRGRE